MTRRPQHLDALEEANRVRLGRVDLRRQVRENRLGVMSAVRHPLCSRMMLAEVLRWQPTQSGRSIRAQTVDRALAVVGASPWVLCGELSDRQLKVLAEWWRSGRSRRQAIEARQVLKWTGDQEDAA